MKQKRKVLRYVKSSSYLPTYELLNIVTCLRISTISQHTYRSNAWKSLIEVYKAEGRAEVVVFYRRELKRCRVQ